MGLGDQPPQDVPSDSHVRLAARERARHRSGRPPGPPWATGRRCGGGLTRMERVPGGRLANAQPRRLRRRKPSGPSGMMSQAIPQLRPFPMPASFRSCLPGQALPLRAGLRSGPGRPLGPPGRRLAVSPDLPSRVPCEGDGQAPARACAAGAFPSRRTASEAGGGRRLAHAGGGKLPAAADGPRAPPSPPGRLPLPLAGLAPAAGAMGLARFGALPADGAKAGRTGRPPSGVRRHACRAPVLAWRIASTQTAGRARAGPGARAFLHGCQPCWAAEDKGLESRWRLHRMDCWRDGATFRRRALAVACEESGVRGMSGPGHVRAGPRAPTVGSEIHPDGLGGSGPAPWTREAPGQRAAQMTGLP